MTEAEELLTDVHTLRRRTRRDRRAAAVPLFLFGALILLAPLCYVPVAHDVSGMVFYTTDSGAFTLFNPVASIPGLEYPNLVSWYWFLTVVAGFTATAWWYRRRALRVGVETDTRGYLIAAGAALAGFLIGVPLLEFLVPAPDTLYSTPWTNLPILFTSAALSAAVLFWGTRPARTEAIRAAGLLVGVLLATIAFAALGVYLIRGFAALLVIAAALLALAWLERSALLGGIGLAFGAAALLANLYNVENLFSRLGWTAHQLQQVVLQQVALPGVILLAGGVAVVLTGRGAAR